MKLTKRMVIIVSRDISVIKHTDVSCKQLYNRSITLVLMPDHVYIATNGNPIT